MTLECLRETIIHGANENLQLDWKQLLLPIKNYTSLAEKRNTALLKLKFEECGIPYNEGTVAALAALGPVGWYKQISIPSKVFAGLLYVLSDGDLHTAINSIAFRLFKEPECDSELLDNMQLFKFPVGEFDESKVVLYNNESVTLDRLNNTMVLYNAVESAYKTFGVTNSFQDFVHELNSMLPRVWIKEMNIQDLIQGAYIVVDVVTNHWLRSSILKDIHPDKDIIKPIFLTNSYQKFISLCIKYGLTSWNVSDFGFDDRRKRIMEQVNDTIVTDDKVAGYVQLMESVDPIGIPTAIDGDVVYLLAYTLDIPF